MFNYVPPKPIAPTEQDELRWKHTALRRRMLQGTWEQDLEDTLYTHFSADRREAIGEIDLSSNVFEQITRQLSVLYDQTPHVTNTEGDIAPLKELIKLSGLWPLMSRVQQYCLGMRETIVRIDISERAGLQYRVVTPDNVICYAHPDRPDQPVIYQEYRIRLDQDKKPKWIVDYIDISDLNNPKFALYALQDNGQLGQDVSSLYMGKSRSGADYPYIDREGVPFLPLTLYHAEKTGQLWNSYDMSQVVHGSLSSATFFTFFAHCLKDASYPQRYAIGCTLNGLTAFDQDLQSRRLGIPTDPASILLFQPTEDTQPVIGQFNAGADVHSLLESISKYEMRVATSSGVSPAELQKTSGDPRSGFALAVSRQGQRESQRRLAPVFRIYDEELVTKSAALANRYLGLNVPEKGYRVSYQSLPLTPQETEALRKDVVEKLAAGLISPVDAIQMLNPDMDDQQARDQLLKIRRDRAEFL